MTHAPRMSIDFNGNNPPQFPLRGGDNIQELMGIIVLSPEFRVLLGLFFRHASHKIRKGLGDMTIYF